MKHRLQKKHSIPYFIVAFILSVISLSSLAISNSSHVYAESPLAYNYTKSIDSSGGTVYVDDIATDSQGDVYLTGFFSGTIAFDGSSGGSQTSPNGDDDVFITKYNADGSYGWTKIFNTIGTDSAVYADTITTDKDGNIYVAGQFTGSVMFDGVGGSDTQSNVYPAYTGFITKYNADGSYGFTKIFDTSSGGTSDNQSLAVDNNGNIYVDGTFNGTVTFDGPSGSHTYISGNVNGESFLTKFNSAGTYQYTNLTGTASGQSYATGLAVDSQGNIYVAGTFQGTVIFDGPSGSQSIVSPGSNYDTYITKYNADGSYGFTKIFDTSSGDAFSSSVAVDSQGNIYIAGSFQDTVTFDYASETDSQTSPGGNSDGFLTKFNADGSYGWTRVEGTASGSAYINDVAIDSQGNIYVGGGYSGTVLLDGFDGTNSVTTQSTDGVSFVSVYQPNSTYLTSVTTSSADSSSYAQILGLSVTLQGNVYVGGDYQGTITFDGPGGTDTQIDSGGSSDVFLSSLSSSYAATTTNNSTSDPTASSLPKAPDTGFGEPVASSMYGNIAIYSLMAVGIGFVVRYRLKNNS